MCQLLPFVRSKLHYPITSSARGIPIASPAGLGGARECIDALRCIQRDHQRCDVPNVTRNFHRCLMIAFMEAQEILVKSVVRQLSTGQRYALFL